MHVNPHPLVDAIEVEVLLIDRRAFDVLVPRVGLDAVVGVAPADDEQPVALLDGVADQRVFTFAGKPSNNNISDVPVVSSLTGIPSAIS